jgi:hypothetical protein
MEFPKEVYMNLLLRGLIFIVLLVLTCATLVLYAIIAITTFIITIAAACASTLQKKQLALAKTKIAV